MEPELVTKLLRLNQEFYATYAQSFAATRHSVQPGVLRLLPQIMKAELVLDLGCGNGNLAKLLQSEGFIGSYFGIDENTYFLEQAEAAVQDAASGSYTFRKGSMADPAWLDLVDEAGSRLRIEIDSMPYEIDIIERRLRQMEIERLALQKEKDRAGLERLRALGAKRVTLKTGAYPMRELAMALKWSSDAGIDLLTVDEEALCATPYDGIASRIKELVLGENPRGTVGSGVGQAYRRFRAEPLTAIKVRDLKSPELRELLAANREQVQTDLQHIIEYEFRLQDRATLAEEVGLLYDDDFLDFVVGRFEEAAPLLVSVLDDQRRRTGERGPEVADAIEELGLNQFDQGKFDKAEEYLRSTGIADTCYVGPEAEFFIFDDVRFMQSQNAAMYQVDSVEATWNTGRDEQPNLGYKPRAKEGYFPVPPMDRYQDLRSEMVRAMLDATRGSVLGAHPMFGPSVHTLQGQRVVLVRGRGDAWADWVAQNFVARGLVITETTAAQHDRAMSVVQVLNHFQTQVLGLTLARLGVPLEETLRAFTDELARTYAILLPVEAGPEAYLSALEERGAGIEFVHGRGKRKTQLQKDIEALREILAR